MRTLYDRILQAGIKMCMLTGVAFTFAACYGTVPPDHWQNEPDYQKAQQKMEQQLNQAAAQTVQENVE